MTSARETEGISILSSFLPAVPRAPPVSPNFFSLSHAFPKPWRSSSVVEGRAPCAGVAFPTRPTQAARASPLTTQSILLSIHSTLHALPASGAAWRA